MKADVIPYASLDYRTYPFGGILQQQFANRYFSIYQYITELFRPVDFHLHNTRPLAALQFTLNGLAHCTLEGGRTHSLYEGRAGLFFLAKGLNTARIGAGKFRSLHIALEDSLLEELAEDIAWFRKVRMPGAVGQHLVTAPVNFIMLAVIEQLLHCPLREGSLNIALRSMVLQLVNLHQQAADNMPYPDGVLHREKLMQIRDDIIYHAHMQEGKLANLSRKYYLRKATISHYFYKLFNVHIGAFLVQTVMEKAVYLLVHTQKTISEISEELGYSTGSNFSRAFFEVYRQLPHEVRTNRGLGRNDANEQEK